MNISSLIKYIVLMEFSSDLNQTQEVQMWKECLNNEVFLEEIW